MQTMAALTVPEPDTYLLVESPTEPRAFPFPITAPPNEMVLSLIPAAVYAAGLLAKGGPYGVTVRSDGARLPKPLQEVDMHMAVVWEALVAEAFRLGAREDGQPVTDDGADYYFSVAGSTVTLDDTWQFSYTEGNLRSEEMALHHALTFAAELIRRGDDDVEMFRVRESATSDGLGELVDDLRATLAGKGVQNAVPS